MTVVTLTTDFGTADGYVGAMKGVVLSLAPQAVLVDIAHDVARHDIAAGAFALAQAAPLFPAGTVHVAVVDPGVGGPRKDLLVEAGGAFFVGPDNGLLALAAREPRVVRAI
jgi:S-adenosylmethionine hydrolase